jgi:2-polyprenyl-6-methoxyphenol hydroxylase-like FAD-dependent oxidoreductase
MTTTDTDVLVVGAGPAGLAMAIELGHRGVRVLLVERNARGGAAPRAKTTNVRTRTHLRRWGIADALAAASPLGIDYPNDILFVTRLAGHRLAHFHDAFNAAPARSELYPEHAQWVPQYTLERIMLDHARTLPGVEVRFGISLTDASPEGSGVVARIEGPGVQTSKVAARYLVGADGARSRVRELVGAKMEGRYGITRNYNIVFRAPGLAQAHPQGPAVQYWQVNRDGASLIGPMDEGDVWFFMPTGMKEGETLSNADASGAIARATGIDLPYEILSTDEWVASRLLADSYRKGPMFLVGDACHLHPPFGGYGMNMGIADSVDLGWKMAAVIQGWAAPELLDTYEVERRPMHEAVMEEAVANNAVLGGQLYQEGLEDDTPEGQALREATRQRILAAKAREFHTLGTVLGLGYGPSPAITPDGTPEPPRNGQVYTPCARPGSLAPHAWLADGRSLYDLFGPGFTLVVAAGADGLQVARATADAQAFDAPLTVVWPEGVDVRGLYGADMALVRPDQYVAWHGDRWTAEALRRAIGEPAHKREVAPEPRQAALS